MNRIAQIVLDHLNGKETNQSKVIISKIKKILTEKGFKSPFMLKIAEEDFGDHLFRSWKQRIYDFLDIVDLHDPKLIFVSGMFKKDFGLSLSPEDAAKKYQKIIDMMDDNELEERTAAKVNPWAICHTTVDKEKDPEKFERCVLKVKKKNKPAK